MTHECFYCGKKFETEEEVEKHITEEHKDVKVEDIDVFTEGEKIVVTIRFNNGSALEMVFENSKEAKRFAEFLNEAIEFLEVMEDSECIMSFSGDIWIWRKGKLKKF